MPRYVCGSSAFVHTPGMVRHVLGGRIPLDSKAQQEATALWLLGSMFPTIPAGDLLRVVQDPSLVQYEGDTVFFNVPDRAEGAG